MISDYKSIGPIGPSSDYILINAERLSNGGTVFVGRRFSSREAFAKSIPIHMRLQVICFLQAAWSLFNLEGEDISEAAEALGWPKELGEGIAELPKADLEAISRTIELVKEIWPVDYERAQTVLIDPDKNPEICIQGLKRLESMSNSAWVPSADSVGFMNRLPGNFRLQFLPGMRTGSSLVSRKKVNANNLLEFIVTQMASSAPQYDLPFEDLDLSPRKEAAAA